MNLQICPILRASVTLLLFFASSEASFGQVVQNSVTDATLQRFDSLEHEVQQLHHTLELDEAKLRLEATQTAFTQLERLAWLAAIIGGVYAILSFFRARKAESADERQRRFYEERTLRLEERQSALHSLTVATTEASEKREVELFGSQIENVSKLGGVIDLIKRSFDLQVERETKLREYEAQFATLDETLKNLSKWYQKNLHDICGIILSFKRHSRMAWTSLDDGEVKTLDAAMSMFRNIPDFVLADEKRDKPKDIAQVLQLMGVGSFYSNDILHAAKYLEESYALYASSDTRSDDIYPRAFCCHYLGVLVKSWQKQDGASDANMHDAANYLSEAAELLKNKEGEVLTPLTLAEVLSYLDSERNRAMQIADRIIKQLDEKTELDPNQAALFGRALLIRGNISYCAGDLPTAMEWYDRAKEQNKDNAYAWLSAAQVSKKDADKYYRQGLLLLAEGRYLEKRECTNRATALAWRVIASAAVGDEPFDRFLTDLASIRSSVRSVGDRQPLFFCPITKKPVLFDTLQRNVVTEVERLKSNRIVVG